ncbi:hypothetical protein NMY22_g913 [Coprinellus aureogranulatus]|nr:hypothetical protein NMY22_g913 [Coprinellus aureogranulatus]
MSIAIARDNLRLTTTYLGDLGVAGDLQWFSDTTGHDHVVFKADVVAHHDALNNFDVKKSRQGPAPPPPAVLSAIVRLRQGSDYFLTACSDWKPGTFPLAKIRPSAMAEDPKVPVLQDDFKTVYDHVRHLLETFFEGDKVRTIHSTGVVDWDKDGCSPLGFKVSHKVFEVSEYRGFAISRIDKPTSQKKSAAGDEGSDENSADETIAFTAEDWPVRHDSAKEHLSLLKDTHYIIPLPAYSPDSEGVATIIPPSSYEAKLRGAVVKLEFYLNHWSVEQKAEFGDRRRGEGASKKGAEDTKKDIFTADIKQITVLIPPLPPTPSRKRALPRTVDSTSGGASEADASPSKKAKGN